MKIIMALLSALFSISVLSQVEGLTIGNAFPVGKSGQVYRGREPKNKVEELAILGITDVIIYKNEIRDEVTTEIELLESFNIIPHHVPFRWKEFPSYEEACVQTVKALNLIFKVKAQKRKVYFHCTAGEDRTGMLAGLFRMLEEKISKGKVFRSEMCDRGYSDGDEHKPAPVVDAIEKELTPLFVALASKIESGEWKAPKIDKRTCRNIELVPTALKCINK